MMERVWGPRGGLSREVLVPWPNSSSESGTTADLDRREVRDLYLSTERFDTGEGRNSYTNLDIRINNHPTLLNPNISSLLPV
jgi:hypothetical protein